MIETKKEKEERGESERNKEGAGGRERKQVRRETWPPPLEFPA